MSVLDPASRSVLAEARQLHIGVLTTKGPHVTPELYTWDQQHLWFLTAADTLKSRVVQRDPRASATVRAGSRTVVVTGTVTEYDVGDALRLMTQAQEALRATAALCSFTVRNAADLLAFARDLAAGRLPSRLPPRRVLLRLRVDRAMLLDGDSLASASQGWPGNAPESDGRRVGPRDPADGLDCVVGIETAEGVLALPGRCDPDLSRATVATAAVVLARVPTAVDVPGCLVVDDYTAPGPAAKQGVLARGTLRLSPDGDVTTVDVDGDRETTWDGAEVTTVPT